MADNKIIAATVQVDTAASTKSMNELNTAIKESKKALGEAKIGSNEYKEAQSQLKKQEDELAKSLQAANGEKGKSAEAFGTLKEKVQGLVPGLKSAEGGVSSFGKQLKVLAANPIILILTALVAVLAFLYEAFASTVEGGKKIEQVFNGVKAVIQVITDRIFSLGNAVIKFFSGDFKGAAADAKAAVSGIGDEITRVFNETERITKRLQEIKKAEREDRVDRSEREKRLALLREQLNDESISIQARKKIAEELRDDQKKNAVDDLARTTEKASLKIQQFKMEKDGERKHAEEIAELRIEVNNTEKENALEGVRTNKLIRNLDKQQKSEDKAADVEAAAKHKEAIQNLREFELKDLKLKQDLELANITDAKAKEMKVIQNALGDELRAIKLQLEEKKISKKQADILIADSQAVAEQKKVSLQKKFDEEEKQATRKFETELNKLELEIKLAGITDVREKERVQLDISFADKRKQAEETYKTDAKKLAQIKAKIAEQEQLQKSQLEKKFADEDEKAQGALTLRKIAFDDTANKKDLARLRQNLTAKQKEIDKQYAAELAAAKGNAQKISEIEQKHVEDLYGLSQAKKAIDDTELAHKDILRNSIISIANNIADAIGKNTVVGKGIAVAGALIDTYAAIVAQLKAASKSPGAAIPGYAIAQAIATGVAGLASVQKIISVQIPGQSGGGGAGASLPSAPAAPLAPTQTSTQLNAASIQGVGNAAAQGAGRTFVLDSDIKNSAERQNRLVRAARLGILIFIVGSSYL